MSGRNTFATTIAKTNAESSLAHKKYYAFKTNREPFFVLMMRLNLKTLLLFLTVAVIFTIAVYMNCSFPHGLVKRWDGRFYQTDGEESIGNKLHKSDVNSHLLDIECFINQEYTIRCKRDNEANEVYVPFSFIQNYFDVNGAMASGNSASDGEDSDIHQVKRFNWMHSNAKVNLPKGKYDPHGIFMYFENYNVEVRDRVKCISAVEGVPVSTQWEKRGYFYPTQIAQFALSHYSKNITEAEPRIKVLEDADTNRIEWTIPKLTNLSRIWHPKFNTSVIQYETLIGFSTALSYNLTETVDLLLSMDILLVTNSSSVMVTILNRVSKTWYRVHYIPADVLISVEDNNIYYGLGKLALNKWRHITRDLHVDVQKGLISDKKFHTKIRRSELNVISIAFLGIGFFDNITFSTSNHLAQFYDAAEWFVNNQDKKTGGWANPVRRNLNGFAELKTGWLSAMGQGHGISVLSRAYWHSGGDKRYLKAASLALKPFRIFSKDGGVLAQFLEKYYWYEEYPTTPPSFVLNGFIYSLLGLYDLNSTAPIGSDAANEAGKLFNEGMFSLKKMLLFYDTGSGTTYDLRHISLGVAPNLARWDYHSAHVNQLLLLATIDSDPTITQTAERWKGYMFGKRAKHN